MERTTNQGRVPFSVFGITASLPPSLLGLVLRFPPSPGRSPGGVPPLFPLFPTLVYVTYKKLKWELEYPTDPSSDNLPQLSTVWAAKAFPLFSRCQKHPGRPGTSLPPPTSFCPKKLPPVRPPLSPPAIYASCQASVCMCVHTYVEKSE